MQAKGARTLITCLLCSAFLLLSAPDAPATDELVTYRGPENNMGTFASNFYLMHTLEGDSTHPERLVLADAYGYLIILKRTDRGFRREWKSFHLGSMVKGLFISDLANDGRPNLIAFTKDRVFVFGGRDPALLWESVESDFTDISCMAIGEFDGVDRQREMLILQIADTGCGIPERVRNRVFFPFFTTKKEHGGTGLGLYQCSRIIRQHAGEMELTSVEGRGTCVTIRIPRWSEKE